MKPYLTPEYAQEYFESRGIEWTTENPEADILRAQQWIDNNYRWPGIRSTRDQVNAWPRDGAIDADGYEIVGVPEELKMAICEALLVVDELGEALDRGGMISSVRVGPITETYMNGASPGKTFPKIDILLANIRAGGRGRVEVSR